MSKSKTIDSWFRATCTECGADHSRPNVGTEDYPGHWKTAKLTCPRCRNRQRARLDMTERTMPTPQELLAVAEKYEHTMPALAKIAVEQLQKGAFVEKVEAVEDTTDEWGEW